MCPDGSALQETDRGRHSKGGKSGAGLYAVEESVSDV